MFLPKFGLLMMWTWAERIQPELISESAHPHLYLFQKQCNTHQYVSENLFLLKELAFAEKGTRAHVFGFVPFSNPASVRGARSANRAGKLSLTEPHGGEDTSRQSLASDYRPC